MKLLFLGDIFGKSGRVAVKNFLCEHPGIADLIVANGENATHGMGINTAHARELFNMGIDVITTGNHVWDQNGVSHLLNTEKNIIRPLNYSDDAPGKGFCLIEKLGMTCLVVNVIGRLFMPQLVQDPFEKMSELLTKYGLKRNVDLIFVDFHAEATSEKYAMGHFLDGKISGLVGTHTHVPTADTQILSNGTAYQSDAGMCGCYDSVIGIEKKIATQRFTHVHVKSKIEPAIGSSQIHGVLIEINTQTGLAKKIDRISVL